MTLHEYWRSSTSYRVRIALEIKGVPYKRRSIDLYSADQRSPGYRALNPSGGVPTLVLEDGNVITQSMAIMEYLDARYPDPPLLPEDRAAAAKVRAAANVVACDIHPLNNLKVTNRLEAMGHSNDDVAEWVRGVTSEGLAAYQALLPEGDLFSFGASVTLADLCLIPQMYNARRCGLDLSALHRLVDVEARCLALPAFQVALPEAHPDAP